MTCRAETLLTTLKTALERIDGESPYDLEFEKAQVMLREIVRTGMEIETNELATRPCIVIALEALGDTDAETVDEFEVPFSIRIDVLLAGTIDETDIAAAWADVRRAIFTDWNGLGVGVHRESLSLRRLDQAGDLLAIDGARFVLTGTYTERSEDPDNG